MLPYYPSDAGSAAAFEDSHKTFREAMPGGFAWEAVEVYSGYVYPLHAWLVETPQTLSPCNITSQELHDVYRLCHAMPQQHMQADEAGFVPVRCNQSFLIPSVPRQHFIVNFCTCIIYYHTLCVNCCRS